MLGFRSMYGNISNDHVARSFVSQDLLADPCFSRFSWFMIGESDIHASAFASFRNIYSWWWWDGYITRSIWYQQMIYSTFQISFFYVVYYQIDASIYVHASQLIFICCWVYIHRILAAANVSIYFSNLYASSSILFCCVSTNLVLLLLH